MNDSCKVSIAMLAYNHEKYIAKAIDSILMQKVNFKYEIVIGEDCSTDGTRAIILDYTRRYPDLFKLILHEHNVGCLKNEISLYDACSGEYIAYLDGDDYWLIDNKLQMQVDFLDAHKEYSSCYTDDDIICDDEHMKNSYRCSHMDINSYDEFYTHTPNIPTVSFIMRNYFLTEDIKKYYSGPKIVTDRITFCLVLRYGKIKYLDVKSCIYRYIIHGEGSFSSHDAYFKYYDNMLALRVQRSIVPRPIKHYLKEEISFYQRVLITKYMEDKRFFKALGFWLAKTSLLEKFDMLHYKVDKVRWAE